MPQRPTLEPMSVRGYGGPMAVLHEKTILISEAHLDSFGHLNNARYLELFEQARWDLIVSRGFDMDTIKRTRTGPVIVAIEMKFLRELAPREEVVITSELVEYQKKIGRMKQAMLKADRVPACEAVFTFGLFHLDQRR